VVEVPSLEVVDENFVSYDIRVTRGERSSTPVAWLKAPHLSPRESPPSARARDGPRLMMHCQWQTPHHQHPLSTGDDGDAGPHWHALFPSPPAGPRAFAPTLPTKQCQWSIELEV
jgi:hypothetical protein